jgi:hypothetical protein
MKLHPQKPRQEPPVIGFRHQQVLNRLEPPLKVLSDKWIKPLLLPTHLRPRPSIS